MGKSAKKRRLAAKRRQELDKLRGISLLDAASPGPREEKSSSGKAWPSTKTSEDQRNQHGTANSDGLSRPRVDFVLPRSHGKAETYIFDRQAKAMINEELSTIQEEESTDTQGKGMKSKGETIDDILFPKKRRKLEKEFESIHKDDDDLKKGQLTSLVPPKPLNMGKNTAIIHEGRFMITGVSSPLESLGTTQKNSGSEKINSSTPSSKDNSEKSRKKRRRNSSDGEVNNNVHNRGQLSGRSVEEAVKDKHGLRPRANSTDGELKLPQRGLCDERMVLEAHRWNVDQNYVHQLTPKGFVNLGNTCFLNSTLQCLAYLPPFCQSLLAISEAKLRNQRTNPHKKLSQGQKITSSLGLLFQRIHGFNDKDLNGAIAPQSMVNALPTLGTCGSRNGYKFRPGRQEDAHEFLVHLLDAMHDGELRGAGINQQISGWRDRLPVSRLDETTFIHRIFGGYFRSQVRCRKCGYRSNTYDPFLDLSLEVSKKTSNSILHSLSEFTKKETLDSENQWRCSGCNKHVCATKQLTVFRPPLSLCVQLKRFTFDGGFGGRSFSSYGTGGWKYGKSNSNFRGGGKITKPIEFPAELDLPLSDSRSCEYTLTGVVMHVGGSASSGHYTAYVKKPGRKGTNQWYHVDDSFVEPVSERTVLRQKNAYLLFYCRKEVKLEFPSPPPRGMSAEEATKLGQARAKARADSIGMEESKKSLSSATSDKDEREERKSLGSVSSTRRDLERTKTLVHPLASPLQAANKFEQQKQNIVGQIENEAMNHDQDEKSSSSSEDSSGSDDSRPLNPASLNVKEQESSSDSSDSKASSSSESSSDSESEAEQEDDPATMQKKKASSSESSTDSSSSESSSSSSSDEDEDEDDNNEEEVQPSPRIDYLQRLIDSRPRRMEGKASDQFEDEEESENSSGEDSSSESSSSSSSDEDEDEDDNNGEEAQPTPKQKKVVAMKSASFKSDDSHRTRIVVGSKESRGKIEVMYGPRKKKSWKSKAATVGAKGSQYELLGNLTVNKWGDEEETLGSQADQSNKSEEVPGVSHERGRIVEKMNKQEKSRKRRMYLDRWDSLLDQGKVCIRNQNRPVAFIFFKLLLRSISSLACSKKRQRKIKRKTIVLDLQ